MDKIQEPFNQILGVAVAAGASDVHLTVHSPPIFRIDGELTAHGEKPLQSEDTLSMVKSILSNHQFTLLQEKGELDFSYQFADRTRFRINAYYQRGSVSMAIRILSSRVPSLKELKMPPVLEKLTLMPKGLILVTGPTGSGKSTTLAAMIDHINQTQRKHIVTLEDPIEYLYQHRQSIIDQREVGSDTHSFANGLRAALRQDPDVILVGEMRDLETISTAITASETGHLVLATLHTVDAPSTIDRIIDSFPANQQAQIRTQLASVLVAIISQRLLPRKSGKGRVVATEILMNTPAVANLIRSEKVHQIKNMMQTGKALGMHTLDMNIKELVQQNLIDESVAKLYLSEGGI